MPEYKNICGASKPGPNGCMVVCTLEKGHEGNHKGSFSGVLIEWEENSSCEQVNNTDTKENDFHRLKQNIISDIDTVQEMLDSVMKQVLELQNETGT